ncbi:O-methyltransferase [Microlunatus panaciterrae]|uniref:Caffeoyl-CoA O-methyltransferase n=1 Tax=Microlunatus panaciterrae TaxID=400768 RepID=A0ABS2REP2_9ACTN|nr:O-methyltransferase [Microlunatus panaciterrae]MBM7797454.1 caffeoyl-CoA O-methyltransferase [Microlunatus panaciterrae]
MTEETALWSAVDTYFEPLIAPDQLLFDALRRADEAGLPQIQVSAAQGKLLQLLVQLAGAQRVLEIGTLAGYSTIWLARALPPDGHLLSCELDPHHAAVAVENLAAAGLADRVEVRVGAAADTLQSVIESGAEPFDLVFIDADKPSNPVYLERSLQLTRPGSVIILDNAVRSGAVADQTSTDPNVLGVRAFVDLVRADPRLSATAIQTVGSKGYDGFILIRVNG